MMIFHNLNPVIKNEKVVKYKYIHRLIRYILQLSNSLSLNLYRTTAQWYDRCIPLIFYDHYVVIKSRYYKGYSYNYLQKINSYILINKRRGILRPPMFTTVQTRHKQCRWFICTSRLHFIICTAF